MLSKTNAIKHGCMKERVVKKILIWGIGYFAQKFLENGYQGEVIGFIQTKKTQDFFMQKPVYECDEIPDNYNYIVVANSYTADIYKSCQVLGIDMSRVIFLYRMQNRVGCMDISLLKEILLERNFTDYCIEFGLHEESFYVIDSEKYQKLNKRPSFDILDKYKYPILYDKYANAGVTGNYFWQDLWAAKLIIRSGVKSHFDIGSRIDGFIAHLLAAEIDVTMIDVRKFPGGEVEHLHTIVDDATMLHQIENESIESMSALCSLEHFGLGRYGDPIDPEACFKCFSKIQRKLKKNGKLYLSVPIGKERVEFNAHRIFNADTIVKAFSELKLKEFVCVTERGMEYTSDIHKYDNDIHNGDYRYGLFYFIKETSHQKPSLN